MAREEKMSGRSSAELFPQPGCQGSAIAAVSSQVTRLLAEYPRDCTPQDIRALGGAGGFSGAQFWRISSPRGLLCLRRWPQHADALWPARLRFIHDVLQCVAKSGGPPVPVPIQIAAGGTILSAGGHLWELTPWLPGEADYFPLRKEQKLRAALAALAEFHLASAKYRPVGGESLAMNSSISEGIHRRRQQIESLRAGELGKIVDAVDANDSWPTTIDFDATTLRKLAVDILRLYRQAEMPVLQMLIAAEPLKVRLQACIRDIWHAHVLFQDGQVSGLVDFGAMRIDTVACDISRLLGSMAQDDEHAWQAGLAAYEAVRPLTTAEREFIGIFDRGTTLLSGINWLQWIFVDRRTFDDMHAVAERLDEITRRLTQLGARG
jgi:Ser/Thr protein kinase RdoA (MazF antagonist)